MEIVDEDLLVSCSMPSLEVGTIGGGTQLPSQLGCTKLLNVNYKLILVGKWWRIKWIG